MQAALLFLVLFLARLGHSFAFRPLESQYDKQKIYLEQNGEQKKADDPEPNLRVVHAAISAWLCCAMVVWAAFGCLKKKKQEDAIAAPPAAAAAAEHVARADSPSPSTPPIFPPPPAAATFLPPTPPPSPSVSLPLPAKKVQPVSSTTFLRVPHEYVKDLTIKGVLGLGASGRAYLANLRGSSVAVKVMEHNVRAGNKKLLGDMPVLAVPLNHPNILPTYRVAVIELPSSSSPGLLPVKMKRLELERPFTSSQTTVDVGGGPTAHSFQVDLLDEYYESDEEDWDIENAEEGLLEEEDEYGEFAPLEVVVEEEETGEESEKDPSNAPSASGNSASSKGNKSGKSQSSKSGTTPIESGGTFRAGRIVHLYDLLPHPQLYPEEIYLIGTDEDRNNQSSAVLGHSHSAPTGPNHRKQPSINTSSAAATAAVAAASAATSGASLSVLSVPSASNTITTTNESRSQGTQSMPLPFQSQSRKTFPANGLSKSLRPGMYEVWAILEFADMGSMEDHVIKKTFLRRKDGTPDLEPILRLLLDVARGMAELHRLDIIHTDLKPSNVMLVSCPSDPRGWVAKISDAGLLPLLDLTLTFTSIRHHSRLQCLPPELVLNNSTTPALDVYCFAMLMWKTWTCERPFKHMKIGCFFQSVIEGGERPAIPDGCPAAYAELMQKCWKTEPAARPSFESICVDLEEQLNQFISSKSS